MPSINLCTHGGHAARRPSAVLRVATCWPSPATSEFDPQRTLDGCFGRIFGLDGRESYRELRPDPLYCSPVKPRNCST
jgi:hypothetical protein